MRLMTQQSLADFLLEEDPRRKGRGPLRTPGPGPRDPSTAVHHRKPEAAGASFSPGTGGAL